MNASMAAVRETAEREVRLHCCSSSVCCMLISAQAVCVPRFAYRGSARHVKGDMTRGSDAGISRVQHVWCSNLDTTLCERCDSFFVAFRSRFASARLSFSGDAKTALFYAVVGRFVLFAHTVCFMLFDGLLLLVRLGRRFTLT